MKTLKTAFLLTALTLLLLFIGEALGGSSGMTIALVVAVLMNGGAYFFSDKIALKSSGAVPIGREESPRLYAVMERLAAKANLPMPKLYLIPQAAPNAFATGRNPSHASVAVTQGLMEIMNDDELEGVIAHELSHVRNYDILTSSIAATLAGAITWIGHVGRWAQSQRRDWRAVDGHSSADRSGAAAVGDFAAARISGGRFGRADDWTCEWADQRAGKIGRLQQENSDGYSAVHFGAVYRAAFDGGTIVCGIVQHASAAFGSHCGIAEYDDHAVLGFRKV
jgi:Zn-dependent protease with chaperone function